MDFIELAKSRYSCKKFDSRQISKEQLDSILEAGRVAPTAKNLQEQHVYVVQSAEGLAKIDAQTPCRYGAPTMLIVAFDKNSVRLQVAVVCPVGEHWRIEREIRTRIKARFDREGIMMPHYSVPETET